MNYPLVLLTLLIPTNAGAESFIVEEGESRAEIIIAAEPTRMQQLAAAELRDHLEKISDDAVIGLGENGGLGILVDGQYILGSGHPCQVLDGAADAEGKENLGPDVFAGLADQGAVIGPSGIYDGAGGADLTREQLGKLEEFLEFQFAAHAPSAADYDLRLFESLVTIGSALIGNQTQAIRGYFFGQGDGDDVSAAGIIMGKFLKSSGSYGGHLRPVVGCDDFGAEIAALLVNEGVQAVIFTST